MNKIREYVLVFSLTVVAIVCLVSFFYSPADTLDASSRWSMLLIGFLFGFPALIGLVGILLGEQRMSRVANWLNPLLVGGWFLLFGGLMAFGGIFHADRLAGGLPFLSDQVNEKLGSGAFVIVGALIALLGLLAGWKGVQYWLGKEK